MTALLSDLRTATYAILNEAQTSQTYPLALVDLFINNAQNNICFGSVFNANTNDKVVRGQLPFLQRYYSYKSVNDTTLGANVVSGQNTLPVGSTNNFYAVNGSDYHLWVKQDIISATGVTATSFTGVTGVDFPWNGGTAVSQLYQTPPDFSQAVRLIYDGGLQMPYKDERNLYTDLKSLPGGTYPYSGYQNNVTGFPDIRTPYIAPMYYTIVGARYILPFGITVSGKSIWLQYEYTPTYMVNASDPCTIPDDYAMMTIPFYALYLLYLNRGEDDRAMMMNRMAAMQIQSMYSAYNDMSNEEPFNQRVQTGKDVWINI